MRNEESAKIDYIRNVFAKEDNDLAQVGSDLNDAGRKMQIGSDEGKILHVLLKMIAAEKVIEIGVLAGYSAIWMARALPENGKLYALEKSKSRIEPISKNLENCAVADKVELIEGDALENLSKLEDKSPFDAVFIDADKANYCNYLDWAEKNVRKGGLIIGDNTLLFGSVYGDNKRNMKPVTIKIMQEFNKRLASSDNYTSIMLPTLEGMTVAIKEF